MKTVYRAFDGKIFENRVECNKYERERRLDVILNRINGRKVDTFVGYLIGDTDMFIANNCTYQDIIDIADYFHINKSDIYFDKNIERGTGYAIVRSGSWIDVKKLDMLCKYTENILKAINDLNGGNAND